VIERAVLWSRGTTLDPEHLSLVTPLESTGEAGAVVADPSAAAEAASQPPAAPSNTGETTALPPPGMDLERWERTMIEQALREASGNQTRAAQRLGISRDTLRYRLKKYGIQG
jgi:DNA-binding NtrC family response regulator